MATSPDIRNYFIGKGNLFFKPVGAADFVHMGNCPNFELTPDITTLDHFSSMGGVRQKDRSVATEIAATLAITLEEFTLQNLRLALLGSEVEEVSEGKTRIQILSETGISGAIKLVGANDVGPRFTVELPRVTFNQGADTPFISDEWGQLELEPEVEAVNGSFGTITFDSEEGEDGSESESESESASATA